MRLTENRERTYGEMMFDKLHNGGCSHNQFLCVTMKKYDNGFLSTLHSALASGKQATSVATARV